MRKFWLMVFVTVVAMAGGAQAQREDPTGGSFRLGAGTAGAHFGFEGYFAGSSTVPFGLSFDGNALSLGFDLEARAALMFLRSDDYTVYAYGGGGLRTENLFDRFGFTTTLGAGFVWTIFGVYAEVEPVNYMLGGNASFFSRFNIGFMIALF
jgi:hypothetical protein